MEEHFLLAGLVVQVYQAFCANFCEKLHEPSLLSFTMPFDCYFIVLD